MSGDARVEDTAGGQVFPRTLSADEWDELVRDATGVAHGERGLAEELRAYLGDEIANGFGCNGRHRMAVEALPVVEGGVRVLVLGGAEVEGESLDVSEPLRASAISAVSQSAEVADIAERTSADSAENAEVRAAGGWTEPRPLDPERTPDAPLDALPPEFRAMVQAVSESMQTDAAIPMAIGLGVVSGALGPASVKVRQGWIEPVSLYTGVVARPGEGKSPALSAMAAPLYEIEREEQERWSGEVSVLASEYEVMRRRLDDAKARAGKSGLGDEDRHKRDAEVERCARDLDGMSAPERPRLVAGDVTPERAATLAARQGGRLAIISDEAGVLGAFLGRYSGGMASIDGLLTGWSGQPITVDRKGDPSTVRIDRPAFTMVLGFQPSLFEAIAGNDQVAGRGFVERFLLCWPVSHLGRRAADAPGLSDEVCRDWERLVRGAFQPLPDPALRAVSADPIIFRLSEAASAELRDLHNVIEPRMAPDGDLHSLTGMAAKMVGQGARLAGVLHVAALGLDAARSTPISGDAMRAAATLALYFVEHARIGMGRVGSRDGTEVILEWVKAKQTSTFSMRDLITAKHGTVDGWTPHLDRLIEAGYMRLAKGRYVNSRRYEVNPAVLDGVS